jgi:hypothetical protein
MPVVIHGWLPSLLAQQSPVSDTTPPFSFSSEIRVPASYHVSGEEFAPFTGGIEYFNYHGTKLHDRRHPNLFSEEVIGPFSFFHLAATYQRNTELSVANSGYSGLMEGVRIVGGKIALGGMVRYIYSRLEEQQAHASDLELGPVIAWWPAEDIYLTEKFGYRIISTFADSSPDVRLTRGTYLQWRHHVAYVPSEDQSFTYAQDLNLRIGTSSQAHINNLNERNYFIFSFSPAFSLIPTIGVNLDYYTGVSTSVLTIPLGVSIEYFASGSMVLRGGFEYDIPTMLGQPANRLSLMALIGYRL